MSVLLDVNGFFEHMVGARGFTDGDIDAVGARAGAVLAALESRRARGDLPFLDLPFDRSMMEAARTTAATWPGRFDRLVVLGIGGSALGTRTVLAAVPAARRGRGLEVEVLDNVDPSTMAELLGRIDPARTLFNVVSKSGQTVETMAQYLVVRGRLAEALGEEEAGKHLVFTTDPKRGLLREIAARDGISSFEVPDGVGGRFSALSAVGLLPLAAAGVDVERLCAGARRADEACRRPELRRNPAALHAALLFLSLRERGASIHVVMPYCDRLAALAEWYAQLWGESLGKRLNLDGETVEVGQTPVRALGATDQHSQVQLYVEGPRDKVVTFLRVENHEYDVTIPSRPDTPGDLVYLGGRTLGELLNMEQRATELALAAEGRLTSTISIDRLDEESLGYLFLLFEAQTLIMAALLEVDPLVQPGVEAGKVMTQAMAGKAGLESRAAEVRALLAGKRRDLVLG